MCVNDPGREVDIQFTTTLKTMIDVWMGDTTYRRAMSGDALKVVGPKALVNDVPNWMRSSLFAGSAPASEIQ